MDNMVTEREKLLKINTHQSFHNNYKIVSKDRTNDTIASPIGEGGSGIVYLAEQTFVDNIKVNRAIKFFVYRDDISEQTNHQFSDKISSKNFNDEILNISSFNHENIIKIIDGGIFEIDEHNIPFIITDYIEGHTLRDFLLKPEIIDDYISDGEDIIDLFGQICNGLEYLHKRNFYHCDIAPKNIFIKGEKGNFQIVIGDLGTGKTIKKNVMPIDNKLFVHGTREYMPQKVLELRNKEIEYSEFLKLQPHWDLFALRKSFEQLIRVFEKRKRTNIPWFNSLKKIISREFLNITEVSQNIERLRPAYRQTAGVPELSEADSSTYRQQELQPLRSVWITDRIKKITRHPLFFRLKKVPQLLSSNTFSPGSNHTRYEHSLGTYENMRHVLNSLLRNEDFLELLTEKNIELALLAALLSSVSKFPFSFIIHEIRSRDKSYFPNITEKKMLNLILTYKNEKQAINENIWEIIQKNFSIESIDNLLEIIDGNTDGKWSASKKIISKLLHSTIDVRVLDFLPRDSYHLGISSGPHINFDSLIENITFHENTIAIRSRGVTYVEQVVTLRYWLYKRIYWNSPNRAYSAVLRFIFTKLFLIKHDFEEKLINGIIFSDPSDIFHLIDSITKCDENCDENLVCLNNLLKTIYCEQPRIFKEVFVINQMESTAQLSNVCKIFSEMTFAQLERLRIELENELAEVILYQPNHINILIDIPDEKNKKLGEDLSVIKYDGTPTSISRVSGLIDGISKTFDDNLKFLRVYLNPIYKNQLETNPEKYKEIKRVIHQFLTENTK